MSDQHYNELRAAIRAVMARENWPAIVAQYAVNGLSDERLRWDTLHASKYPTRPLYAYLTDAHIDTALRAIFAEK